MAARNGQPKGPARTEARQANKGGASDIGQGLDKAADQADAQLASAFAKHNAKGNAAQPEGHVPFAKKS
jgi:hypothetical protein